MPTRQSTTGAAQPNRGRDDAPNPEELLRTLVKDSRGHHKIYVGAAAGVGKTYRALQELHERRELGTDAVVGLMETHGRKETLALSEGLETVPRRVTDYKGVQLTEMDTAGILARRPELVLVDELAHTNVPGSERQKRYEDVEEILGAGINVISTMNIQHLESANDLVARLTGVRVKERVPDRVLLEADEVILVDVTPEILRERLKAGKIYSKEKIEQALSNFFTLENLSVLRELALREVADAVEDPAAEAGGHKIKERIAVAITARPDSAQLIRRGARIAQRLDGELHVVYVRSHALSRDEERLLDSYRVITEALEGTFAQVEAPHQPGGALIDFIKRKNITQVIMGTSLRRPWQEFFRGSVINQVLRQTQDVDVYIIGRKDR